MYVPLNPALPSPKEVIASRAKRLQENSGGNIRSRGRFGFASAEGVNGVGGRGEGGGCREEGMRTQCVMECSDSPFGFRFS